MRILLFSVFFLTGIIFNSPSFAQGQAEDTVAAPAETAIAETGGGATPEMISEGESLFKANCRTCHRVHEDLVGPKLAGVTERAPSTEWIVQFIQNSQKLIQAGDPYAVEIYNEYNKLQMPPHPFTEEQVMSILAYVQAEEAAGPPQPEPIAGEAVDGAPAAGETIPSFYLNAILIGLVIVLVLILLVLVLIITILRKYINQQVELDEEDQAVVNPKRDYAKTFKSPAFLFIVIFIFTAVAFKGVINGLYSVGIQKGYAPEQPIAFSHELHAGTYEIDCQYCHTGVQISKNANIPSANICMNCHKYVATESLEVQKIWAAADYQAETDTYGPNQEPIQWIRVHNIPDLAYFNHAQHVNVGGVECESCHGDIKSMEVVQQHALLTMGWCIDCHRETNLNAEGNDYYNKLIELHEGGEMKVEDIGGLECAKCHY
ncbi:MAG: cytochrome c3 family protein [Candidatus Cyclobacteriaceae bacterium M2_1C_046]